MRHLFIAVVLAVSAALAAAGEHPFMLWTKADIAQLKQRIAAEPWAKAAVERELGADKPAEERHLWHNLLRWHLLGDREAAEVEKAVLLKFIAAPPLVKDVTDHIWHKVDHSLHAFRYDGVADLLAPAERRALDSTLRKLAVFGMQEEKLRGWEGYPRMASHAMCALATGDKRVIEDFFATPQSLKAYLDGLVDGRFSTGTGNPSHKHLGQLLIWCLGCANLGLDHLGFGYVSPTGASVRSFLQGMLEVADPPVRLGDELLVGRSALAEFVQMEGRAAAASRLAEVCAAPLLIPRRADGGGGWGGWSGPEPKTFTELEGGNERMMVDLAFEIAHRRWGDAGFDWALAQMRAPGSDSYLPSLHSGIGPIAAAAVKPPALTSAVYRKRGVALLRGEEGPAFWTSPAPMAVLRLGAPGERGSGASCLSLAALHAFNRPIYRSNPPGTGSHDPYSWSAKRHATLVVDNRQTTQVEEKDGTLRTVNAWPRAPGDAAPVRSAFGAQARFVGARAPRVTGVGVDGTGTRVAVDLAMYPGVEIERCLVLTRSYLVDVMRAASDEEHAYHWLAHALGSALPDDAAAWQPTTALSRALAAGDGPLAPAMAEQRAFAAGDAGWSVGALQTCNGDPARSALGAGWYAAKVGVRLSMLGEPGTTAYTSTRPLRRKMTRAEQEAMEAFQNPDAAPKRDKAYDAADQASGELELLPDEPAKPKAEEKPKKREPPVIVGEPAEKLPETGGVSFIVERRARTTAFVALHEPFQGGAWKLAFRRIAQGADGVAAAVRSTDGAVDDRVLIAWGEAAAKPLTLEGDGERFVFTGYGFVRIAADRVDVEGDIAELRVKVAGAPKLHVAGKPVEAAVAGGVLSWRR